MAISQHHLIADIVSLFSAKNFLDAAGCDSFPKQSVDDFVCAPYVCVSQSLAILILYTYNPEIPLSLCLKTL